MPECEESSYQSVLRHWEALLRSKITRDDQMHAHAENIAPISTEDGLPDISGLLQGQDARGRRG
jgi:hypothetical protein